jgi:aubergine-like protein
VGKIVVTAYNKRCYRIEDIDFSTKPTSTFDRDGVPTSYIDYFRTVHNQQIRQNNQPMLKVVPNNQRRREEETRVTLLVPELCNIAGLTETQRTDNRLKMDLIRASQIPPNVRVQHMKEFLQKFHGNEEVREQLQNWGYAYGKDPCQIKAHILAPTGYAVGTTTRDPLTNYTKADANSADIRINCLAVVPTIAKMIILTPRGQMSQKGQILGNLREGFDKIQLKPISIEQKDMDGDSSNHYITAIRNLTPDTTVAIVIMQSQNKERYDAIKKAASVERGLITQVVTARLMTDPKRARSAAQKIAIQVAAKVGGEPWWVDIPLKKTMVCGYDAYHDTTQRGRSFGAFVASLNMRYSRWWSKADVHDRMEEISSQMALNVTEALKVYRKFNKEYPEKVIIYRDGVGEGQLEHVFKVELKKVKEALSELNSATELTFIVVCKRIGARFYMRSRTDNSFSNPPPGTVIDHTVTRQERYDFYLISQSTRQGTVTPTYYNIIHDEAGFAPEIHQKLAFKLTLLYYNWSGTVRVPAPCQYAHKLAYLCGEHLHGQPNARMDDKLHYL